RLAIPDRLVRLCFSSASSSTSPMPPSLREDRDRIVFENTTVGGNLKGCTRSSIRTPSLFLGLFLSLRTTRFCFSAKHVGKNLGKNHFKKAQNWQNCFQCSFFGFLNCFNRKSIVSKGTRIT